MTGSVSTADFGLRLHPCYRPMQYDVFLRKIKYKKLTRAYITKATNKYNLPNNNTTPRYVYV